MNRRPDRHGFTLVELLIAILVLTVITGIVYTSFISVADTTAAARESAVTLRLQQQLWRVLTVNLNAVYIDSACAQPEYQFLGENLDGPFGPADRLTFCSALPVSGPAALPGERRIVTLEVVEDAENTDAGATLAIDMPAAREQQQYLLIHEAPLVLESAPLGSEMELDDEVNPAAVTDEVLAQAVEASRERRIPIHTLNFLYYSYQKEEWVEAWDSFAEQALPWAIRVQVNFPKTGDEIDALARQGIDLQENPDLDLLLPLPMGAGTTQSFIDLNHFRGNPLMMTAGDLFEDSPRRENR
jgi:prepilin-type N-terminal cleavage/methylation domain-containing protein